MQLFMFHSDVMLIFFFIDVTQNTADLIVTVALSKLSLKDVKMD